MISTQRAPGRSLPQRLQEEILNTVLMDTASRRVLFLFGTRHQFMRGFLSDRAIREDYVFLFFFVGRSMGSTQIGLMGLYGIKRFGSTASNSKNGG